VALNYDHSGQVRPEVGDAIAGTGAHWRVRLDTISVVKSMLDVVLAARVSGAKPEHSANRSVLVVSKWHGAYHAIAPQLRDAFKHPDVVRVLQEAHFPEDIRRDLCPLVTRGHNY
jgi:hypothetical protein